MIKTFAGLDDATLSCSKAPLDLVEIDSDVFVAGSHKFVSRCRYSIAEFSNRGLKRRQFGL